MKLMRWAPPDTCEKSEDARASLMNQDSTVPGMNRYSGDSGMFGGNEYA